MAGSLHIIITIDGIVTYGHTKYPNMPNEIIELALLLLMYVKNIIANIITIDHSIFCHFKLSFCIVISDFLLT